MNLPISLTEILTLEQLDTDLFRGLTPANRVNSLFGGQVIAQALQAAQATVEDHRVCHSLHAYFLRPGDPRAPIIYEAEHARDGKAFAMRRVTAVQHGKQILNLSASFHDTEQGLEHSMEMPAYADHDHYAFLWLPPEYRELGKVAGSLFDFRIVEPVTPSGNDNRTLAGWFRVKEHLPDDRKMHIAAMAYGSDFGPFGVMMKPHGLSLQSPGWHAASLDHALWLHRPFNLNDWHLYILDSPTASQGRGFARGMIYAEDGALVASTAQEGLIRRKA